MNKRGLNTITIFLIGCLLFISKPLVAQTLAFVDVEEGSYYEEAVEWAVENGITGGTTATTFSPDAVCTRGQVVAFLYRANGSVEPTTTDINFVDVTPNDYYYKAVLWAVENGITGGTSPTTFGPNDTCTAGQVITFLWRANGSIGKIGEGEYYTDAVNWSNQNGLLEGMGKTFNPNSLSPRKDIVTYLFRAKDIVQTHEEKEEIIVIEADESNKPYTYYRNTLNDSDVNAYDVILKGLLSFEKEIDLTGYGISIDKIQLLMRYIINDRPDIYWTEGKWTYWYDDNNNVSKLEISYISTIDEVSNLKSELEYNTKRLLEGVDEKMSDTEKVRQIHDNIIKSSYYSDRGNNSIDLRGVMIEGRGVCESYAEATKYLLDQIGIPSIIIRGDVPDGGHEWNLVLVDNKWLALDTTWDDPIGDHLAEDYVSYDYFLIPIDEMMKMDGGRTYDHWYKDILPK